MNPLAATLRNLLVSAALCCLPLAALAHPAEGQQPRETGCTYGWFNPVDWTLGDLRFYPAADHPGWDELTDLEKYILCGTSTAPGYSTGGLADWQSEVFGFVSNFYNKFGYVPQQLSRELIEQTPGYDNLPEIYYELYRNPLTDAWPRLDALEHSPGDIYMRPLTAQEKQYYAERSETYYYNWIEGVEPPYEQPGGGEPITLTSEVFYMLVWGKSGPLGEGFIYHYEPAQ